MNEKSKYSLILVALLMVLNNISGQIPVIQRPKPTTPAMPNNHFPTSQGRQINPFSNIPNLNNQIEMHERDKRELQQRNTERNKTLHEYSEGQLTIYYERPSQLGRHGTQYYLNALEKLSKMLRGESILNLKEAIFTVENAFFENQLNYFDFNSAIHKLVQTAQLKTIQDGYDWKNPITKNVMLFRTMSDTMEIKIPQMEASVVSYPMQYDFDDFFGENDWTKMFVSKLLATNKGQCHSLPLLYLILCEETGADAHLAYSPSHSYIKFKDSSGNWYNFELTNGRIVSDAYIIGSGYITSEAIKNKIYLEPQTKLQVIAHCLSDLTMGYIYKYGYDNFVTQCLDSIFKYDPNNLSALKINSNHITQRYLYVIKQLGFPDLEVVKTDYPQAYALHKEMIESYERIDATGHREMPKEAYEVWLNAVNKEKERQEQDKKYNKILQPIR